MEGKLIPMRDLRALAKRVGMEVKLIADGTTLEIGVDGYYPEGGCALEILSMWACGKGSTKRAAQIQARNNVWKFLECVLTMEYGEGE